MNNKISYEDILTKIGTYYKNGNLYFRDESEQTNKFIDEEQNTHNYVPEYSYIHNKYFKNYSEQEEKPLVFDNPTEYRNYLIKQIIDKARIRQIKTTKMKDFTNELTNNYSNKDLNKLFDFSKR
jgi:hypothetical protein